jgi:hypothetical protein
MRSTLEGGVPPYLGADLTDRYSKGCRPIDVCGLTPGDGNTLAARFWTWEWDRAPRPLDVAGLVGELAATRAAMLDGPQGLARKGNAQRDCERQSAAVGKTPDIRPSLGKPFGGFICSSLDLFGALAAAGSTISPRGCLGGVSEVYPGHIWMLLCPALPKKSSRNGRLARKRILEALGVSALPGLPTHDQNDACVAALLASAADGLVPGMTLLGIGASLVADLTGTLREGPMIIPMIGPKIRALVQGAPLQALVADRQSRGVGAAPPSDGDRSGQRAERLLDRFIDAALAGKPEVCTYAWACRRIFGEYRRWSQAYAKQVIRVALRTRQRELSGLGFVRLDTFVVAQANGFPSGGHWESIDYHREDWERVLGSAAILR